MSTATGVRASIEMGAPVATAVGASVSLDAPRVAAVALDVLASAPRVDAVQLDVTLPKVVQRPVPAPLPPQGELTLELQELPPVALYRNTGGERYAIKTTPAQQNALGRIRNDLYHRLVALGCIAPGTAFYINATAASCSFKREGQTITLDLVKAAEHYQEPEILDILGQYRDCIEDITPGNVWKTFVASQIGHSGGASALVKPPKFQERWSFLEHIWPSSRLNKLPKTVGDFVKRGYLPPNANADVVEKLYSNQRQRKEFLAHITQLHNDKKRDVEAIKDPAEAAEKAERTAELEELAALKQKLENVDAFAIMMAIAYAGHDKSACAQMAMDVAKDKMLEESKPWFFGEASPLEEEEKEYLADMGMLFFRDTDPAAGIENTDRTGYLQWCLEHGIHAKQDSKEIHALTDATCFAQDQNAAAVERLTALLPQFVQGNGNTVTQLHTIYGLQAPAPVTPPGLVVRTTSNSTRPARAAQPALGVPVPAPAPGAPASGPAQAATLSGLVARTPHATGFPAPAVQSAPAPGAPAPAPAFLRTVPLDSRDPDDDDIDLEVVPTPAPHDDDVEEFVTPGSRAAGVVPRSSPAAATGVVQPTPANDGIDLD